MAKRWVYSVVDIADYFLQPIYFGVESVGFKIGSELDFLNRTLSVLREFKKGFALKNTDWLVPISQALIYAVSWFGTSEGGVMVEVSGQNRRMSLCVLAAEHGESFPLYCRRLQPKCFSQGRYRTGESFVCRIGFHARGF